jgi:hypothetical protein
MHATGLPRARASCMSDAPHAPSSWTLSAAKKRRGLLMLLRTFVPPAWPPCCPCPPAQSPVRRAHTQDTHTRHTHVLVFVPNCMPMYKLCPYIFCELQCRHATPLTHTTARACVTTRRAPHWHTAGQACTPSQGCHPESPCTSIPHPLRNKQARPPTAVRLQALASVVMWLPLNPNLYCTSSPGP